jgi:dTDP-4-dehydrorhamnose 3,5-epimerase
VVRTRELAVPGAVAVTPAVHPDERGTFFEWFRVDGFAEATGVDFTMRQANVSTSRRGVLRGVHFADVPPGQAKFVTCMAGSVVDFVVDIRVGSPTFGTWDAVVLDAREPQSVYIPEGLGHAFLSLEEGSTVAYLLSSPYAPGAEHGIDPLDPQLGLDLRGIDVILSEKDRGAPSLAEAAEQGLLPLWPSTP